MSDYVVSFQDVNSLLMMYISGFNDHVMLVIILIVTMVTYVVFSEFYYPCSNRFLFGSEMLEIIWTVVPSMILLLIGMPSIRTLYLMDEVFPSMTLKCIGHQWYWSYEYGDLGKEFDSYMVMDSDLHSGMFRLLEVDNHTVLPSSMEVRVLVTSSDVIHSWTIPSLGVKMDAVPGRLNQFYLNCVRVGLLYGQCSEICGAYHSFMPICLEMVPESKFIQWVYSS